MRATKVLRKENAELRLRLRTCYTGLRKQNINIHIHRSGAAASSRVTTSHNNNKGAAVLKIAILGFSVFESSYLGNAYLVGIYMDTQFSLETKKLWLEGAPGPS